MLGEQICDSFSLGLHGSQDLGQLPSASFSAGLMIPHSFWSVLRGGPSFTSISEWLKLKERLTGKPSVKRGRLRVRILHASGRPGEV